MHRFSESPQLAKRAQIHPRLSWCIVDAFFLEARDGRRTKTDSQNPIPIPDNELDLLPDLVT